MRDIKYTNNGNHFTNLFNPHLLYIWKCFSKTKQLTHHNSTGFRINRERSRGTPQKALSSPYIQHDIPERTDGQRAPRREKYLSKSHQYSVQYTQFYNYKTQKLPVVVANEKNSCFWYKYLPYKTQNVLMDVSRPERDTALSGWGYKTSQVATDIHKNCSAWFTLPEPHSRSVKCFDTPAAGEGCGWVVMPPNPVPTRLCVHPG